MIEDNQPYSWMDSLTDNERGVLSKVLRQVKKDKFDLGKPKQIREIVPIEKWVESEYYLGPDCVRLYDVYKDHMKNIFQPNSKINEIILTGGIGVGKSTLAIVSNIRKLYEISCFENIPALFNLMTTSKIVFIYFSLSKKQAELTGFGQIREMLDTILIS